MAITREEVQHVARLARLSLQEAEAERLRGQLSAILDYVRQLDRLDTRDVVPTSHAIETGTPFRDDVVEPFGDREALLANAPDRQNDCLTADSGTRSWGRRMRRGLSGWRIIFRTTMYDIRTRNEHERR